MPAMRTDDGPRKLRAVWLGPKGATLPFEWTYVQWLVTLVAMPVCAVLASVLVLAVGLPSWLSVVAFFVGAYGGLQVAVAVMNGVSYDEPLADKKALFRAEFSRSRVRPQQEVTYEWPQYRVMDLSPAAAALLTPEKDYR